MAHVSGDHFVAYVRAHNQWLLCNDATVSVVSVLGPVWPCLIVLERLRRQQLARPARQAPPAGSDCLRRLPRVLQETVAPGPDAPGPRAAGAPPGLLLPGLLARALGALQRRCSASVEKPVALVQVSSDGSVLLLIASNRVRPRFANDGFH